MADGGVGGDRRDRRRARRADRAADRPLAAGGRVRAWSGSRSPPSRTWATGSPTATTVAAQLGVYVGKGIGFDCVHALGCVVFALAFGPALIRSIQRFARRLQVDLAARPAAARLRGRRRRWSAQRCRLVARRWRQRRGCAGSDSDELPRSQPRTATAGFGAAPGAGRRAAVLRVGRARRSPPRATTRQDVRRGGHSLLDYIARAASAARRRRLGRAHDPRRCARPGCPPTASAAATWSRALSATSAATARSAGQVNLTAFAVLALRAAGHPAAPAPPLVAVAPAGLRRRLQLRRPQAARATSTTPARRSRRWALPARRPPGPAPGGRVHPPPAEPRRRLPEPARRRLERPVDRVGGPGPARGRRRPGHASPPRRVRRRSATCAR